MIWVRISVRCAFGLALASYLSIRRVGVAKMASNAIFQYNVLEIDDTHNTWTNMIVKMNILRLFRFK